MNYKRGDKVTMIDGTKAIVVKADGNQYVCARLDNFETFTAGLEDIELNMVDFASQILGYR